MKKAYLSIALALTSLPAFGYDCKSDCSGGGYSYPCGISGWPPETHYCHGDLPNDPACLAAKEASCKVWNSVVDGVTHDVAARVAPQVAAKAESEGWTKESCGAVGAGAILLPAATYIAPTCAASAFITAGVGVPVCVTTVSGAIVAAVCIQLCADHHLQDCK
jgi:hypothetical protein